MRRHSPAQSIGARTEHRISTPATAPLPGSGLRALRRYSRNTTCSLQAVDLARHGGDVCQLTSTHEGWPVEPDSIGTRRISVAFGESDCAVTLTGCNPDTCYTIFDLSSRGDGYAIRNACAPLATLPGCWAVRPRSRSRGGAGVAQGRAR